MATREEKMEAFGQLLDILDELRVKCPWDRKQTNESLRTNTIEETYELCEALMREDNTNIKKELGDLLLHIVFYSKIGEEKEAFDAKLDQVMEVDDTTDQVDATDEEEGEPSIGPKVLRKTR